MNQKGTTRLKSRISAITAWSIALLLWPIIWYGIVGEKSDEIVSKVGLLWPIFIIVLDMIALNRNTYESAIQTKRSILSMDASTICSLTFAISSILGSKNNVCCSRIFMAAIVFCIAFVLPAPNIQYNAVETIIVESIQKAILAYAIGFIVTGILLTLEESSFSSKTTSSIS